ncbi:MAG TPA: rRNA maturation RNase YbeY [Actinomycetota bacterium]|nr:rRNA maturation RNase YbeY [Actinomycetota bacterium]
MSDATVPKRAGAPVVVVSNRQSEPVDEAALSALAERTLEAEGAGPVELSLSFVGLEEMADLHERFMHEPGPTDVLSFPLGEDGLLGDVVVCPAQAGKNNPDQPAELRLLVVHGVLHLLGFDHDTDQDRAEMWARQELYSGVRL